MTWRRYVAERKRNRKDIFVYYAHPQQKVLHHNSKQGMLGFHIKGGYGGGGEEYVVLGVQQSMSLSLNNKICFRIRVPGTLLWVDLQTPS